MHLFNAMLFSKERKKERNKRRKEGRKRERGMEGGRKGGRKWELTVGAGLWGGQRRTNGEN